MPANDSHGTRGTAAMQRLVEYAPSTGGLALWMPHRDMTESDSELPTTPGAPLYTDGRTLFYCEAFEDLPIEEQTGWVAHMVLHVALRHAQRLFELQERMGDVDAQLFNTCADAIVNSSIRHLRWLTLPAGAVELKHILGGALGTPIDDAQALLEWDVERLYRAIDDRRAARGTQRQRKDGPRAAAVRAAARPEHADLRPSADTLAAPEHRAEESREWRERVVRAHAGDAEFSLLRTLLADLPKSRTPWELLLRAQLTRALAAKRAVSWSRPTRSWLANQGRVRGQAQAEMHARSTRRMPWEPGHSALSPTPRLVLVLDISGSIDAALLERFVREVQAIVRRTGAGLTLVVGDMAVRHVRHLLPHTGATDLLASLQVEGGGGTDFTPLLQEAEAHAPDLILVLTDLEGPARTRPKAPVIWAVPPQHAAAREPFGRLVVLE